MRCRASRPESPAAFGLVLGVNRGGNAEALADAGAHSGHQRPRPHALRQRGDAGSIPHSPRPTCRRRGRETPVHARGASTPSLPGRSVAPGRAGVLHPGPGRHRDDVRRGQRVPGHASQPVRGPGGAQPRHLPQRLPRDLADPPRRGRVRVRQDRPDHRQRPGRQADEAVRRRRAAAAEQCRPRALRAGAGLPRRHLPPRRGVADPGRQADPRRRRAYGQPRSTAIWPW